MASFKELYAKFRGQLQESWLTNEVTGHFGPTATLDSMFKYMWSRPECQQILVPPLGDSRICKKGSVEADKFRIEGNRLYKERKLEAALMAYNYSVITSPHPTLDQTQQQTHQGLSLAFANRSAVLYEMGQFSLALSDADRALKFGYPEAKQYKMQERRAKCLQALGKRNEARNLLDETLKTLSTLSLDEKEESATRKSLIKLQSKCEVVNNNEPSMKKLYERVFYTGPLEAPELPSYHSDFPCLNDAIAINYTPIRGRHLVADRDIHPGEVLIVEDSISSVLIYDGTLRIYCTHCLRRCPAPLPCSSCSLVVFCSENCQRVSVSGSHGAECQILPVAVALQLDPAPAMALRILASMTLPTLRNTLATVQQEGSGAKTLPKPGNEYRTLYNLEGHATARNESQLQETAAVACIITHILFERSITFLKGEIGQLITPSEDDIVMVGGQLMRLILGLECNIHITREAESGAWGQESEASRNQGRGRDIGWSVYGALSLINHSCVPNALSSSHGNKKFLYSVSIIPKGAEITETYGERYVSHDRTRRRGNLQNHYYFCCDCAACQADWPLFKDLPAKPQMRCPSCCQALSGFTCKLCGLACTSETKSKTGVQLYDASSVQVQLHKAWGSYVKAAMEVNSGKVNADIMMAVINVLMLLDKYTVHPNQYYITAQETLMYCFDLLGSVNLLVPV